MPSSASFLSPSDAARRLGVSVKALRVYGADDMARAHDIVALRALGLSLAEVGDVVLNGNADSLSQALSKHQSNLERRSRLLCDQIAQVRGLRVELEAGRMPSANDLANVTQPVAPAVAFDLPWPWGGERFELVEIKPLTFIVGPLFSGKTRLAGAIAAGLPGGVFVGLDRLIDGATADTRMTADPTLDAHVRRTLDWLAGEGASVSPALVALVAALEAAEPRALVIDMVEQGLDETSQEAVISHLRRRGRDAPPLFVLTRSNVILDLGAVRPDEAIIFCPANHAPPSLVQPFPGAPGYEAVATCLGSPDVRARTEGVVAIRTPV